MSGFDGSELDDQAEGAPGNAPDERPAAFRVATTADVPDDMLAVTCVGCGAVYACRADPDERPLSERAWNPGEPYRIMRRDGHGLGCTWVSSEKPAAPEALPWSVRGPKVETVEDAARWLGIQHRQLCSDAEHIAELYNRIAWFELPWWRRAGRRPPWLRQPPPKFAVGRHLRP